MVSVIWQTYLTPVGKHISRQLANISHLDMNGEATWVVDLGPDDNIILYDCADRIVIPTVHE